jgi:assimilatory nitrate reductase catalytic subunit
VNKTVERKLENAPGIYMTRTTCPYCAVQCSFDIVHDDHAALEMRPTPECPVAHGSVCKKGLSALEVVNHAERLTTPLVRKNGILEPASWDEALERVVRGMQETRAKYGPNAYGVFGGGSLTNEVVYLLGKLARVGLKTANIDYNGRFCMSSAAAATREVYGLDRGLPFPVEHLERAKCIVLWGANLAETLPPLSQYISRARKNGAAVIVIDPRAARTSFLATHIVQVQPGGDLALALALQNVIFESSLERREFLENRTDGWREVADSVSEFTPEWAAERTGLEAKQIRDIARVIARRGLEEGGPIPEGVVILSGRGPEQQARGVDTVRAMIHLALSVGGIYAPLTGQGNGQGGREHGQKADQLPGYRSITDARDRLEVAHVWGISPDDLPGKGLSAQELLEACSSSVRGLLVLGSNPVVSAPNALEITRKLEALDHLVVIDFLPSETAQLADVVLPGSMWLESDGTMTNFEGRVLRRRKVTNPPGQAWMDWRILCDLGARLGHPEKFAYSGVESVFNELARITKGAPADYSGITYKKLGTKGVFWPCPDLKHLGLEYGGTPEPFKIGFHHDDGRAHLRPIAYRESLEEPDLDYPVRLTTGRHADQYQSGVQTRRVPSLTRKVTHAEVQIHPDLAAQYGFEEDAEITLETRRGSAQFTVTLNPRIRQDTVFVPFHWPGAGRANVLTNAALDPVSRMPEFKVAAVRLEKTPSSTQIKNTVQDGVPVLEPALMSATHADQNAHSSLELVSSHR